MSEAQIDAVVDTDFWSENGYVVVPNAAPADQLQSVVDEMWRFTAKDPADPATWPGPPVTGGGMVNMYCSSALWAPRQSPRIHEAFTQLWKDQRLWVTINRANLNPPYGPEWKHEGFIHWDMDPLKPINEVYQGVLLLADTDPDMGGFQCVPGSHRQLREWQDENLGRDVPPDQIDREQVKQQIMAGREPTRIDGRAGDLIIWDIGLLHGNGRNTTDRPRLAQYICMTPQFTARSGGLVEGGEDLRQARIDTWQHGPWLKELARAFGVAEGHVRGWIDRVLGDGGELEDGPYREDHALLDPAQFERACRVVRECNPLSDSVVCQARSLRFGVTVSGAAASHFARIIGDEMNREFGLGLSPEPASLTPLGRRLLGLDAW